MRVYRGFEWIKRLSFQRKLLISMLLLSILPTGVLGMFSYNISTSQMFDQLQATQQHALEAACQDITNRIASAEKAAQAIQIYCIRNSIPPSSASIYEQLKWAQSAQIYIASLKAQYNLEFMTIYLPDYLFFVREGNYFEPFSRLNEALAALGLNADLNLYSSGSNWCFRSWSANRLLERSEKCNYLRCIRTLRDTQGRSVVAGYSIDIRIDRLIEKLLTAGKVLSMDCDTDCLLLDRDGTLLYGSGTENAGTQVNSRLTEQITAAVRNAFYDNDNFYITQQVTGHQLFAAIRIPINYVHDQTAIIGQYTVLLCFILLLVVILLSILLSRVLTRKITRLSCAMNSFLPESDIDTELDKLTVKDFWQDERDHDEINKLTATYNMLILRIQRLMSEVIDQKLAKEKQAFMLLQSQIKPHFLYNLLESVNACIGNGQSETAQRMLLNLALFYRNRLSNGNDTVSIRDEVENCALYLELENLCYGDKIAWKIDVDVNIEDFLIPKFTLQPIIENSINYGMRAGNAQLHICVSGRFEENDILLEVEDDGMGMPRQQCEQLNAQLKENRCDTDHFGIANVNSRIRLFASDSYGIVIHSSENTGTRVQILLSPEL